jgi:hypothetical protein
MDELQIETPEEEITESISLREEIENAQEEVRTRDDSGRFSKKDQEAAEVGKVDEPKSEVETEAKTDRPSLAPNSYSSAAKADWDKVPASVAAEIARREQDTHREFTKQDGERQYGRSIKAVIDPYMPLIAQAGGSPEVAIKNLMETARILQTGDPATKTQLIRNLCKQHGVTANDLGDNAPYVDPQLQNLNQRLHSFEEQQRQQQYQAQQQQDSQLQGAIGEFSANPANVHFEQVKGHMAALLSAGLANDLQDAYDQAIYARPDTRSSLIASQQKAGEEKRLADMKAKADAARRAGGSLTGSPGGGVSADPKAGTRSLRDELQSQFSQNRL